MLLLFVPSVLSTTSGEPVTVFKFGVGVLNSDSHEAPLFPLWIVVNAAVIFLSMKAALRAIAGESWRYPWIVRVVD